MGGERTKKSSDSAGENDCAEVIVMVPFLRMVDGACFGPRAMKSTSTKQTS